MSIRPQEALLYPLLRLLKSLDRRSSSLKDLHPDRIRNILVVSSTAIGDTLLSTPAFHAVRRLFPRARIIAHFNADNMELFENNPDVDGVIPYYGGYRRFWPTVWRFGADLSRQRTAGDAHGVSVGRAIHRQAAERERVSVPAVQPRSGANVGGLRPRRGAAPASRGARRLPRRRQAHGVTARH